MNDADSTGCMRAVEADAPLICQKRCRQPEVWTDGAERLCRRHWEADLSAVRWRLLALQQRSPLQPPLPRTALTHGGIDWALLESRLALRSALGQPVEADQTLVRAALTAGLRWPLLRLLDALDVAEAVLGSWPPAEGE